MENEKSFSDKDKQGSVDVGVQGQFEKSEKPVAAKMMSASPDEAQTKKDAELLLQPGDSYTEVRKGTIYSGDGETSIPVDLTFIRTRNAKGGIDVICQIPALGMCQEVPLGAP